MRPYISPTAYATGGGGDPPPITHTMHDPHRPRTTYQPSHINTQTQTRTQTNSNLIMQQPHPHQPPYPPMITPFTAPTPSSSNRHSFHPSTSEPYHYMNPPHPHQQQSTYTWQQSQPQPYVYPSAIYQPDTTPVAATSTSTSSLYGPPPGTMELLQQYSQSLPPPPPTPAAAQMLYPNPPPLSMSDEVIELTPPPPPARLHGSCRLDGYFGVSESTRVAQMKVKRARTSSNKKGSGSTTSGSEKTPKKDKNQRTIAATSQAASASFQQLIQTDAIASSASAGTSTTITTMEEATTAVAGIAQHEEESKMPMQQVDLEDDYDVNMDAAAATGGNDSSTTTTPLSSAPTTPTSSSTAFNSLFVRSTEGFGGRAIRHLITQKGVLDLADYKSTTVIAQFRSCMATAQRYTMCVFNQDLSTNFRVATNEQRKFIRQSLASKRKGEEEMKEELWRGIRPPTLVLIRFFKQLRVPPPPTMSQTQNQTTASTATTASAGEDDPNKVFDPVFINPSPYQLPDGTINFEPCGTFLLPIQRSLAKLVPTSLKSSTSADELAQISHAWQLRKLFLQLLQDPPPNLHATIFDAKSVIAAIMIHFHISSIKREEFPQLVDILMGAWMCDPDDNRNTGYNLNALYSTHVGLRAKTAQPRLVVDRPGLNDLDIMFQDIQDSLLLWDRLVALMKKFQLVEAYLRQEMKLLPVVIEMQVRGIAIDRTLFEQAEHSLKRKITSLEEEAHNAAGFVFNLGSSAQVSNVLYDKYSVPEPKLIDKGRSQAKQKQHPTTNDSALKQIIANTKLDEHPRRVAKAVLSHRGLFKILNTYLVPYGRSATDDSHLHLSGASAQARIYANWCQSTTGTGRLSCRNPNLQALPRASPAPATSAKPTASSTTTTEDEVEIEDEDADEESEDVHASSSSSVVTDSPVIGMGQKEVKPINLPSDVNMRASIVPTPAHIVHDIARDRQAHWINETKQIVWKTGGGQSIQTKSPSSTAQLNEERCILSADYSQMEVRLLAQLCRDPNLIRVFNPGYVGPEEKKEMEDRKVSAATLTSTSNTPGAGGSVPTSSASSSVGGDVYRRMASIMFQKSVASVSDSERNISKTIVLGVMYGMGADSLAGRLTKFMKDRTVTVKEAQGYINRLYEQFPRIQTFMQDTKAYGLKMGYVKTLIGRCRFLPNLQSRHSQHRAYAERQAVNTVIQGSAADMTKMAMIGLKREISIEPELNSCVWLILQLHDEIILELPTRLIPRVVSLVRRVMEAIIPTANVPFTTNIKIGPGLGQMQPVTE